MKYAVNEDGIQALNVMASSITEAGEELAHELSTLSRTAEEYAAALGPHKASLNTALDNIQANIDQAAKPIEIIASVLCEVADSYEDIVDNNPFHAASESTSSILGANFLGRILGVGGRGNHTSPANTKFGSFDVGQLKNGTIVIKGNNFDKYYSEYYNSENSVFESLGDSEVVETISPSMIEGVHLGDTEMQNSENFWSMHASSKEFFAETASHIPEVKAKLDSGLTLEQLRDDPKLGKCASIFFDPKNMPRVEKCDGYYTFDGDGRHRILTAREFGYDIPVRIVGIRHWN